MSAAKQVENMARRIVELEAEIARLENLVYELRGNLRAAEEQIADSEAEAARLRDGLRRIRSWDCLNPPRPDLLADLPWLAREIDALLAEDGAA